MNKPFSQFLPESREILIEAQRIAEKNNETLSSKHILVSIIELENSVSYDILANQEIDLDKLKLSFSLDKKSKVKPDGKDTIKTSMVLAKKYGHKIVAPEHILLAIITNKESSGSELLRELDIDPKLIKSDIEEIFEQANQIGRNGIISPEQFNNISSDSINAGTGILMPPQKKLKDKKLLPTFSTNLIKLAKEKKLDPLIGREEELNRTIKILNRRTKNNPVLVGEAGVGKTAIVEGLAQKIAEGNVPDGLKDRKLLNLDLSLILAGTKYRGQFEERIKKIVKEIKSDPKIIIFLDEIHTLSGAGAAEGSIDAANIIKPALAKGELRLIGATTIDEYRKYIEKDNALERRLQMVKVEEPTTAETIKILEGLRENYENHHNTKITNEAIKQAVKLSDRYITDRKLPDKAIDLIDEAASAINLNQKDDRTEKLRELKSEIEDAIKSKEKAVIKQDYEQAANNREKELKLKSKLIKLEKKQEKNIEKQGEVGPADIANVVSEWTDIPVTNLAKAEKKKFQDLAKNIKKRIVGQNEAIEKVTKAIGRSRTGISQANRPIGSFIFLGPTGVGKTETAKVLARTLFEKEDALIRVDMSEFMEKHSVSKMVGSPPGYVGYDEGGKLTEQVRRNPYSVILLDEIEKAHSDIQNILLQILEDGFLTDGQGRKVDFSNTVIIMTSNIGVKSLSKQAAVGFQNSSNNKNGLEQKYKQLKEQIIAELKDHFRPEFLNRLDDTIVFKPLDKEKIKHIVKIQLEELKKRIKEQSGMELKVSNGAVDYLSQKGFDPDLGARPVRREISKRIEDKISEKILNDDFSKNKKKIEVTKKRNSGLEVS
jgi:ATP-dependent Clp protease ATP-binding subunit ClpC